MLEWIAELLVDFEPRDILLTGGLVVGLLFGALAQKSSFCFRRAILDGLSRKFGSHAVMYGAALAMAILGSQWLFGAAEIEAEGIVYLTSNYSIGAIIVGGLLFGVGMVLTNGCTARHLVLASEGSARSWVVLSVIAAIILGMIGMAQYAALVTFWPYNLELSLANYDFDLMDGGGWDAFYNSIEMALYSAFFGTIMVFFGAYLVQKGRAFEFGRGLFQMIAIIPLAVPGMVLGLAYIFFFNSPDNPLNFLYGTMTILVIVTITHFYTVCHLTSVTALQQMDNEFESVSASLKAPFYKTFFRVTVPVCSPAMLDVSLYLFLNAMTTVSAVVFLYSSDTTLASLAVLNMDDAGDIAPAAAMAMTIAYTCVGARIVHAIASHVMTKYLQAWRKR